MRSIYLDHTTDVRVQAWIGICFGDVARQRCGFDGDMGILRQRQGRPESRTKGCVS